MAAIDAIQVIGGFGRGIVNRPWIGKRTCLGLWEFRKTRKRYHEQR